MEQYGIAVALSATHILAGAPGDDTGGTNVGRAFLHDAQTGALLHVLPNPSPENSDGFGWAVSISETLAMVGVPSDDAGLENAGSAYLFDVATGSLLRSFHNPEAAEEDHFGFSVAVTESHVLIGTPFDDKSEPDSGSAYLFDPVSGALLHTLKQPSPRESAEFGASVSLSGSMALIGAPYDYEPIDSVRGAAFLFDVTSGAVLHTFRYPVQGYSADFGVSVSLDGSHALIGAPRHEGAMAYTGAAYLFDTLTGDLLHSLQTPATTFDGSFGASVYCRGNLALVGAPDDFSAPFGFGRAYVFDTLSGNLIQGFGYPEPVDGEGFGNSVALHGTDVLIGAPSDDTSGSNSGSVWLFDANAVFVCPSPSPSPTPSPTPTATPDFCPAPTLMFFSDSGAITIPPAGTGTPYPSGITVSGLVGTVEKVTVEIFGLAHAWPDDLDIAVRAPGGGPAVMLMSDCGGDQPIAGGIHITFDEEGIALPDNSLIGPGVYRPTDYLAGDVMPAPGPGAAYGTSLTVYEAADAATINGDWELFVLDDTSGDAGIIGGGWRINFQLCPASGVTPTPSATATTVPTGAATPTPAGSPLPTTTLSPTPTPPPTSTPSPAPSPSYRPTQTPTPTPSRTPSPTATPTETPTPSPTPISTTTPTTTPEPTIEPGCFRFGDGSGSHSALSRIFGNVYTSDAVRTLSSFRAELTLSVPAATAWFYVLEGDALNGGYEISAEIERPLIGSGRQFHDSGFLGVDLIPGKFYAIGVHAATGSGVSYHRSSTGLPRPWAGGTVEKYLATDTFAPPLISPLTPHTGTVISEYHSRS